MTAEINLDPRCIIKQGYLIKSPPMNEMSFLKKSWRKRWFVLYDTAALSDVYPSFKREIYLYYFKNDVKVVNGVPKGKINLSGVEIYKQRGRLYGHDHVINIQTPHRLFHLVASQIFVCNEWLIKLKEHHISFEEETSTDSIPSRPRCLSCGTANYADYRRSSEPVISDGVEALAMKMHGEVKLGNTTKSQNEESGPFSSRNENKADTKPKTRALSDNIENKRDIKPRPVTTAYAGILKMEMDSDNESDEEYLECDTFSIPKYTPHMGANVTNSNTNNNTDQEDGEEVYGHLVFDTLQRKWISQSCKAKLDSHKGDTPIKSWLRKVPLSDLREHRHTQSHDDTTLTRDNLWSNTSVDVEEEDETDERYENIEKFQLKYESEDEGIGRTDSESSSNSTTSTTSTTSTQASTSFSPMQDAMLKFKPRDVRSSIAFDHFTGPKFTTSTTPPAHTTLSRARSLGDISSTNKVPFIRTKQYEF